MTDDAAGFKSGFETVNDWLRSITPGDVLKWGAVVFAYCLGILIVISIVLAMFGVYD